MFTSERYHASASGSSQVFEQFGQRWYVCRGKFIWGSAILTAWVGIASPGRHRQAMQHVPRGWLSLAVPLGHCGVNGLKQSHMSFGCMEQLMS